MAEKIDTAKLLAATDIVTLVGAHVQLTKDGTEFAGLCPFHAEKTPSFKVNPAKQIFHCFGCGAGSDALDFLQKLHGISFKEACEMLGAPIQNGAAPIVRPALKTPPARRTFAAPTGEYPDLNIRRLGEPVAHWEYRDAAGALLGVVARYDTEAGKEIRCFSWGNRADHEPAGWECAHFGKPRPLYGLDRLAAMPTARVIVVEGEKTADAAALMFPKNPVVTWPGGANAVQNADWRALDGRECILIPDNDPAGHQAMTRVAAYLLEYGAAKVMGINPETQPDGTETPAGWDVADTAWTPTEAAAWAKSRMVEYPPISKPVLTVVSAPETTISTPDVSAPQMPAETPPGPELLVVDGNALRKPVRREIEPEAALPPEYSEDALAESFTVTAGVDWRSIPASNVWLKWSGDRWILDKSMSINHEIRLHCRQVSADARDVTAAGRQRIASVKTGRALADMARSDPRHATTPDDWDADDWMLGVPGGSVDLRTGEFHGPNRDYLISRNTSVAPARGPHPLWDAVLARASGGDPAYARFLQTWAGLTLSGDTSQEAFLFLHGKGGSGKSTFVDALREILGDYAMTSPIESFTASGKQEHSTEIARLAGARMVCANETEEGSRFNESRIKQLTGRDRIAARLMRENFFEFTPKFKLWIVGNHRPALRSVGEEMRRRIHLVEFPDSIPEGERDPQFKTRLQAEFPAILQWAIDGALMYRTDGLTRPAAVVESVDQYLQSEDILGAWIDDCADQVANFREKSSDLYRSFSQWAQKSGEYVFPAKRFKQKLFDRGLGAIKSHGQQMIIGLRLKLPDMPDYGND